MSQRTSRLSGLTTPRPALRTPAAPRLRASPPTLQPGTLGVGDRVKAAADFAFAAALAVVALPLVVACVLLVRLTSRGPAIYTQTRVGRGGRIFVMYKIRTMYHDCESLTGPRWSTPGDTRITPVGRVLRKLHLDELPQLWNVLKGDMSLVGPRPILPSEVKLYDCWHRRRLSMTPGVTCLWQVNGRNNITDFNEWVKLDLEFIDNWSLWLEFKILMKTIPVVLFGVGAK